MPCYSKTIDATIAGKLLDANASLADALSGLERVLTSRCQRHRSIDIESADFPFSPAPLPFSYALHLKHVTWLYLTILPFQLLPTLGYVWRNSLSPNDSLTWVRSYLTIPATFIAGYTFLGFLEIGSQIEQPVRMNRVWLEKKVRLIVSNFCSSATMPPT